MLGTTQSVINHSQDVQDDRSSGDGRLSKTGTDSSIIMVGLVELNLPILLFDAGGKKWFEIHFVFDIPCVAPGTSL